jgi:hypothetical protein
MKQRLGHPVLHMEVRMPRERRMRVAAHGAGAQEKRRDFSPALAACGGGHIPVPGVVHVEFHVPL